MNHSFKTGTGPVGMIGSGLLLPNEPRIYQPQIQAGLTRHYLLPFLEELHACLLAVRVQLDPQLARLQPRKLGKPYPLGQCLEIAQAVEQGLRVASEATLSHAAAIGLRALRAFQQAGGAFRQVWGDLRGQYFQNAFQLGTLYVDVANDTVTPTKPKVEIMPFDEAGFVPIRDFDHFCQIAVSYWGGKVFPNHVLPQLAPHCPLIYLADDGGIRFYDVSKYMLALTCSQGFAPSVDVLKKKPMPAEVFEQVCKALPDDAGPLPKSAKVGRELALRQCRDQRAKRWHHLPAVQARVVLETMRLNMHLARYHLETIKSNSSKEQAMSIIRIDNKEYELDSLPAEARTQLQSIQYVNQELARLRAHTAAMETARNAYMNALKALLPAA